MIRPAGTGHTLGVAIEIPDPVGRALDAERARCVDDGEGMPAHVTLLPPFDVDDDVLDAVLDHIAEVAADAEPFRLVLRGTGTFRPVSPVVFVTVADGISACELLEMRVRSGPLAVERRFPYHPHVTVAHDVGEAELDECFERLADFHADVEVGTITVRENVDGRWVLLKEFPLGR